MALTSTEIDTAIRTIISTGQSYTLPDGRSMTRANLHELRQLRDQVVAEEEGTQRGVYRRAAFRRET